MKFNGILLIGLVVLSGITTVASQRINATGDYVRDTSILENLVNFYDRNDGLHFDNPVAGVPTVYEHGDFNFYEWDDGRLTITPANVLMNGSYRNIHSLFGQTLCLETLENPNHEMKEKITINYDSMWWQWDKKSLISPNP